MCVSQCVYTHIYKYVCACVCICVYKFAKVFKKCGNLAEDIKMSYYLPQSPNNINVNLKVFIGSDNIYLPASVRLYQ